MSVQKYKKKRWSEEKNYFRPLGARSGGRHLNIIINYVLIIQTQLNSKEILRINLKLARQYGIRD